MPLNLKNLQSRESELLPSEKQFEEMIHQEPDLVVNMYACYLTRRLHSLGFKPLLLKKSGRFTQILIRAQGGYVIGICSLKDEEGNQIPIMQAKDFKPVTPHPNADEPIDNSYSYSAAMKLYREVKADYQVCLIDRSRTQVKLDEIASVDVVTQSAIALVFEGVFRLSEAASLSIYPLVRKSINYVD